MSRKLSLRQSAQSAQHVLTGYTKSVTGYQGAKWRAMDLRPRSPRSDAVAIQNGVDVGYAGNLHHLVHGQ